MTVLQERILNDLSLEMETTSNRLDFVQVCCLVIFSGYFCLCSSLHAPRVKALDRLIPHYRLNMFVWCRKEWPWWWRRLASRGRLCWLRSWSFYSLFSSFWCSWHSHKGTRGISFSHLWYLLCVMCGETSVYELRILYKSGFFSCNCAISNVIELGRTVRALRHAQRR